MDRDGGDRLWERDPDACCDLRKVRPLNAALADVDAWVAGLRRDQSPSRAGTPKLRLEDMDRDGVHARVEFAPRQ